MNPGSGKKSNPGTTGEPIGLLIGGSWVRRPSVIEVRNPYDGHLVDTVCAGTAADVREAIAAAEASLRDTFPTHARYSVLMRAAAKVEEQQDEYAWTIAGEGSKAIREARREPPRA